MSLSDLRAEIRALHRAPEAEVLGGLIGSHAPDMALRERAVVRAADLVARIRADGKPGLMEAFLAEYGLSTNEGVALMCLAEALLRVPDDDTMDALIEDKIAPSAWGEHLGQSSSSLVNASTWALMLTGKVLDTSEANGVARVLHGAVKRLGEPVIRTAVKRAMKEMGDQFVLGRTVEEAIRRGKKLTARGYTYSYDMLGEAAITAADADIYFEAYRSAIARLAADCVPGQIRTNPGISIKLSALYPRYDALQKEAVMADLTPRVLALALAAREADMGLNIDAEEADRLDLSLDIIEAVLSDPALAGWDGFGVVVQAYGKRAGPVIDWLAALAKTHDRKLMVRLVKGAYWDSEVKHAQVEGLSDYPVFTRKAATDVSYICCAAKLLAHADRLYPQFATHNAHTVAAIQELADEGTDFEFQRLHGMGETLYELMEEGRAPCRIYAPVGVHRDLLAYLVRRLLENGANSSFVNQIVDLDTPIDTVVRDPFEALGEANDPTGSLIGRPADLFGTSRRNSRGWDIRDEIEGAVQRSDWRTHRWVAAPMLAKGAPRGAGATVTNPASPRDIVGAVSDAAAEDVARALDLAEPWQKTASVAERAAVLRRASDVYEANAAELFALLAREAGKTLPDAIAEVREAVDFLRYYAAQAEAAGERPARGVFTCISPWNFPLAIFSGQIGAALAAGNSVLAKPAEETPLIAARAVELLYEAGVPRTALQLLPGPGHIVGAALTSDPRVDGVCFTGSTETAQIIHRAMADHLNPSAPLIAETGGLNAMIVDSTALPQQAVTDIVASAFQSAGQRCSALRMLYIQADIAETFLPMLYGAMDTLALAAPWDVSTDVGPIISAAARDEIAAYVDEAKADGRLLKQVAAPTEGHFISPCVIAVDGIADLEREVFGPVLHVARFEADKLDNVMADINATGYGLTFGLHTRIDNRVEEISCAINAGNLYINRNQIGAIVGSQPFGGEGMSGTGPKAGGPHYLSRFVMPDAAEPGVHGTSERLDRATVQAAIDAIEIVSCAALETHDLPGPTGESNRLSVLPRGLALCLGPTAEQAAEQAAMARSVGCSTLEVAPGAQGANALDGTLDLDHLAELTGFHFVALWSDEPSQRKARHALASRVGAILPLVTDRSVAEHGIVERHVCIDTTAAGGNASLLAAVADAIDRDDDVAPMPLVEA